MRGTICIFVDFGVGMEMMKEKKVGTSNLQNWQ